ncbi:MAG TPA: response regulator [Candidatus Dormibacteraeota bacterium]|nr:response regulator [Candidatus Dormibacteraeota bacterium]
MPAAARVAITFIGAASEVFGGYLSYLRNGGHNVSAAVDVRQASTQAGTLRPDLVFLDFGDPSPTGLALLRELRSDIRLGAIPVVLLASFEALEDARAGLELGACDYVIKTETSAPALARCVSGWARNRLTPAGMVSMRQPASA